LYILDVNSFMNTEIIIITIILFLSVTSLCFGIINWVLLSGTSAKISSLEAEIDKKTKEFDALKKEKQLLAQMAPAEPVQQTENPPIEIVRNLRPGFQNSPQFASSFSDADILDVVDENSQRENRDLYSDSAIAIALFSPVKKDTDFASAWKQLSQRLSVTSAPRVILDFKNVMFLYDKELLYLEKMRDVILSENGRLEFVNCHAELRSIISRRPALAGFIV